MIEGSELLGRRQRNSLQRPMRPVYRCIALSRSLHKDYDSASLAHSRKRRPNCV